MRLRFLFILTSLVIAACGLTYGESITVDHVDGMAGEGAVIMGGDITFHIRMSAPDNSHKGLTNGWRIYSPTDANWTTTSIVATDALSQAANFDLMYITSTRSITGSDADTVTMAAAVMFNTVGMPQGFDDVTHLITIGPIDAGYEGGEICIDSSWYPSGIWKWAGVDVFPDWGGPYCYCIGSCGGADPVIDCPPRLSALDLCAPEEICVPLAITDADDVVVTPSGTWAADQLCFTPDGSSPTEVLTVTATNATGSDVCEVTFNIGYIAEPSIACPDDAFNVPLSAPGEVCVAIPVANAPGGVTVDNDGTWTAGQLCFDAAAAGTFVFEVIAIGDAACSLEDTCEVTVNVTITADVVIDCPTEDYLVELCQLEEVCVPLVITNQTGVTVDNDGTWAADELCFTPTAAGTYDFHVVAEGGNGPVTCDLSVVVSLATLAYIECPTGAIPVVLGGAGEVCVPLVILYYDQINIDNGGTWSDGELCFQADTEGSYTFNVEATSVNGSCPSATCEVIVDVTFSPSVTIDCPAVPFDEVTCAAGDEVCVPLAIVNQTSVAVDNDGTWADGELCFTANTEGAHVFHVTAEGQDGPAECDVTVNVTFTGLPTFTTCPGDDALEICPGDEICLDVVADNYNDISVNFGAWTYDMFCFTPDAEGVFTPVITATNDCGTAECTFSITVAYPVAPEAAFIPVPADGAVPLEVSFSNTSTGFDLTYSWDFGDGGTSTEFEPNHTYGAVNIYTVTLTVTDGCDRTDVATQEVRVTDDQVVVPSDRWIVIGSTDPTIDGVPLADGAVVTAYDQEGTLCGMTIYNSRGILILTVYGDSPYTPDLDEGMDMGELIAFEFDGVEVFPATPIAWDNMGNPTPEEEVFVTEVSGCINFSLDAEWHLISWNVNYAASVGDFVAIIEAGGGTVDVILGFDQEGLTYDPALPQYSTLHDVDYLNGYWVHLSTAADFDICGDDVIAGGIAIYSGWNLVSYLPGEVNTVEDALVSIWDILILVYGYDHGYFDYIKDNPLRAPLEDMAPGFGYWIRTDGDGTLTYPGFGVPAKLVDRSPRIESPVTATRNWMSLYGENISVDGEAIPSNSTIEAYTLSGILCGIGDYTNNMLKFTPVYGADDNALSLPQIGDRVEVRINGEAVTRDIIFGENGTTVDLSNLAKGADLLPTTFGLSQNYPNPFNPSTTISFNLPNASQVTLSVYNVLGQSVNTLADEYFTAGEHNVTWNGDDANGNKVTSGVYFYKIMTSDFSETKKMILMK